MRVSKTESFSLPGSHEEYVDCLNGYLSDSGTFSHMPAMKEFKFEKKALWATKRIWGHYEDALGRCKIQVVAEIEQSFDWTILTLGSMRAWPATSIEEFRELFSDLARDLEAVAGTNNRIEASHV